MRKFGMTIVLALVLPVLVAQPAEDELRRQLVETALMYRGVPYVYGSESPQAFDCSGFTRFVYTRVTGLSLPRSARGQYADGTPVSKEEAKPGDILGFDTFGSGPSHVGIYLGDGKVIHAASAGSQTGVIVSKLSDKYYAERWLGVRRYLQPGAVANVPANPPTAQQTPPAADKPQAAQTPKPAATSSPATQPAAPPKPGDATEAPLAQIGFDIMDRKSVYADKIPAAVGTSIAFTLTNRTAKDTVFEVLFYKANRDFKKTVTLRRDRVTIATGKALEIESYLFTEPGLYRLIVKSSDNDQLVQRDFKVVDAGK